MSNARRSRNSVRGSGPDLAQVNRRLSFLNDYERDIETPVRESPFDGTDISEVSTIAATPYGNNTQTPTTGDTTPGHYIDGLTREPTHADGSRMNPADLVRTLSLMQVRKTVKHKWAKKGYQTTTQYFYEELDGHWTSALIVMCFFISGAIDSVTFQVYSVFTSLQTGNTIFLALRISNQPASKHRMAYIKSVTSLCAYLGGGLFFNVLHRGPTHLSNTKPRLHRWRLFASFAIQAILLLIAAALAQTGWTSTEPFKAGTFSSGSRRFPDTEDNNYDLISIAFLAFEASGQVCLSRVLSFNDLPTIVISTLYHDFVAEALCWRSQWKKAKTRKEFWQGQQKQIRRIVCIFALFLGALVGGFVFASPGGIAGVFWICSGLKIVVSVLWCVWPKKVVTETIVTREPYKPGEGPHQQGQAQEGQPTENTNTEALATAKPIGDEQVPESLAEEKAADEPANQGHDTVQTLVNHENPTTT